MFWTSEDGSLRYGLKMAPTDHRDAVLVTLESGETYPIPSCAAHFLGGLALFYRCLWCRKPRRRLYLLSLIGAKLDVYLGLRCQVCAGLRFGFAGALRQKLHLRLVVNLFSDLEDFLRSHRPHGTLTGDATEPAWNGYLLTVAYPCGVVFGRWVTPLDAELDLLRETRLN
ncbi:MAG: hypothetical protein DMD96_05055 [Candidatus Rokuibacteriota bacterium]|nr:MAG: hypothetical protein DMD96_05055 [Candidatus Rokubacteria bacterium]